MPRTAPAAASGGQETPSEPPAEAPAPPEAQKASEAFPSTGRIVQIRIAGEGDSVDMDWRAGIVVACDPAAEVAFVQVGLLPDDVPFANESRLYRIEGVAHYRLKPGNQGDDIGHWRWPPRV